MSKSKRELLKQLLELEDEDVGDVVENMVSSEATVGKTFESIDDVRSEEEKVIRDGASLEKPKKKLTEKQLEALKKGQQKRNENREKNRLEKQKKEEEERKILEEKLVKKAIAVKKKQIKKQALLDEISDDETPIEKVKQIASSGKGLPDGLATVGQSPLTKIEPLDIKKGPVLKFF